MPVFKLSQAQLELRIRKTAGDSLLEVLRKGRIRRTPEPNLAKGSMECRMERFVAGSQISVVAAISDEHPNVIVVTAMHTGATS